jgi:hypothetical protein
LLFFSVSGSHEKMAIDNCMDGMPSIGRKKNIEKTTANNAERRNVERRNIEGKNIEGKNIERNIKMEND